MGMQKPIEFYFPHYEIPQPSIHILHIYSRDKKVPLLDKYNVFGIYISSKIETIAPTQMPFCEENK